MTVDERIAIYESAFADADGDLAIGEAERSYLAEALTGLAGGESDVDLEEVAWAFESLGVQALSADLPEARVASVFDRAFRSRRALWALSARTTTVEDAWLLVASGTLANRQPELRRLLDELDWDATFGDPPDRWDERVFWQSARALLHLARKANGWEDVHRALESLRELGELQEEGQRAFLAPEHGAVEDDQERIYVALNDDGQLVRKSHDTETEPFDELLRASQALLGIYHLAEALLSVGSYLQTGTPDGIVPMLQRHGEHCRHLLSQTNDKRLARIGETVAPVTIAMARASIWANTARLSEAARQFVRHLTHEDRSHPVLELWWSQREALAQNLLDPFQRAISIQMPTSAGKTLLAEFAIVQSLALNPDSAIAYIVPNRALVSQITKRLRGDLEGVDLGGRIPQVEAAVPVFELDPTEDLLLQQAPDVLVTTPEKLDLLIRSAHGAVANLSLVVVDEAHHISDPSRGARLELLLGTLKRERGARCRFLLLTPFLPNASELSEWLGDAENVAIELNWRPSEQIRAIGKWRRRDGVFHDQIGVVPSATQPASWEGFMVDLGEAAIAASSVSRPKLSASMAIALSKAEHGGVLVLTKGPGTAEERATQIAAAADLLSVDTDDDRSLLQASKEYIASELGEEYPLLATLDKGVAYHHAGLPPEVRALVESLLERGAVRAVAGTSTLAQGVNFPLAAVVIEVLKVPQRRGLPWRPMTYAEFWNVAGRAGRALKDRVGTVVWPSTSPAQDDEFRDYLRGEATEVVSALSAAVLRLNDEGVELNLQLVRNQPALSHFLQYLAHALRVAGYDRAVGEVEDILRSSLVYRRLRRDDYEVAENLVRWARGFFGEVRGARFLPISDSTGFSLPSIGLLAGTAPDAIRTPEFWDPENLFGEDPAPFTRLIEVLSEVPELSLASDAPGGINAARVAGIVRDWVGGATLPQIAEEWYPNQPKEQALKDAGRYLFRELVGQVPWGLGALQAIGLGTDETEEETILRARRVPAMTFYGVSRPEALSVRMVGVPRAAADELGQRAPAFTSFTDAREWVAGLSDRDWDEAGQVRGISGATLRRMWLEVGGTAA
jgi:hypothetical protein